jgi:hypothetical protein
MCLKIACRGGVKMKGYKITYFDENGKQTNSFFGEPIGSKKDVPMFKDYTNKQIALFMFLNAHPDCEIISVENCLLKDYQVRNVLA